MKRRFFTLLSSMFVSALIVGCSQQNAPSANTSAATASADAASAAVTTKIVIGLDDNFPPMGFRNDKGEIVGFDIDMAREAAKRMNIKVEFKSIDWSAKEAELKGKRIDALWNGMTITEERKKNIAFSKPYMQNHQIVIVAVASPILTKADLKGKVVGIQDGSSAVDAVNKEADLAASMKEIKTFADNVAILIDLTTGRLDAVVMDEVVGRYYANKKPGQYRILEENFGTEDYGVGLRQEDTALMSKLDAALDSMKEDGTTQKIYSEWFGKTGK